MRAQASGRIQIIDALRGLSVVLMVVHHFLYDLVVFLDAPVWLFTNPVFDVLHYIFAGTFIMLSGVSSRFSRSNIIRGLKVIAAALVITVVTYFMDVPIYFGILHFLGFAMVFYGLSEKLFSRFNSVTAPIVYTALLIASVLLLNYAKIQSDYLWVFGIPSPSFYSADYFPIFPWIFVFLIGTWLGRVIREGNLPERFYSLNPPLLPKIGRRSFLIYLVHQPVLYGVTLLIGLVGR